MKRFLLFLREAHNSQSGLVHHPRSFFPKMSMEDALREQVEFLQVTVDRLEEALRLGEDERNTLVGSLQRLMGVAQQNAGVARLVRYRTVSPAPTGGVTRSSSMHADPYSSGGEAISMVGGDVVVRNGWRYTFKADRDRTPLDAQHIRRLEAALRQATVDKEGLQRDAAKRESDFNHQMRILQGRVASAEASATQHKDKALRLEAEVASTKRKYEEAVRTLAKREASGRPKVVAAAAAAGGVSQQ